MTKILRGYVRQGRMVWDSPEEALEHIKSMEGKRVEVVIRMAPRKPSVNQHRYYRGIVLPVLGEHMGCAPGETHRALHGALKRELLPANPEARNPKVRSTANLSRQEFAEYLNQVFVLASELGVVLPSPGEVEP